MSAYDIEAIIAGLELPVIRAAGDEVRCVCPKHQDNGGKQGSVGDYSINIDTGEGHCFSCGYKHGSPITLIADVMGIEMWEAAKWARDFALLDAEMIEYDDAGIQRQRDRRKARKVEESEWISDAHLAIFEEVPFRMLRVRDLSADAAGLYEVLWSKQEKCWILPVRMPDGELIGYQKRAKGWERNYPESMKKSVTLFGIDKVAIGPRAIIVESPLDAVRLATVGYQGAYDADPAKSWWPISSMGADVSDEQIAILTNEFDEVLVAMDNDNAGWRSATKIWDRCRQRVQLSFLSYDHVEKPTKDVGDMDDEQIHLAVKNAKPFPLR